jgi:AcrR family transcriptional regulator
VSPRIRDPKSKARIVEAAWREIAEVGLKGATVRAIAARADVSTGYVMHYFPDKGALAAAVLAHNNARAARRVATAQQRHRGVAAVTAIMEALLPVDAERRLEWQVWVAFWNEGDGAGLGQARDGLGALVAASLRDGVDDGELRSDLDLVYEAQRLLTLVAGLGLLAGVSPARAVRSVAQRMLDDHLRTLSGVIA